MFESARGWFDCMVQWIAALLVVALLVVVTLGIVSRGFDRPLSWTDELSGFLMVWLACFGWMLATRRGAHIKIRYFQELLPRAGRDRLEAVMHAGAIVLGAVIAWKSIHLIQTNSDVEATTLPIATAWMYVPLLPAGLLTMVQAAADAIALLRGRDPHGDRPAP